MMVGENNYSKKEFGMTQEKVENYDAFRDNQGKTILIYFKNGEDGLVAIVEDIKIRDSYQTVSLQHNDVLGDSSVEKRVVRDFDFPFEGPVNFEDLERYHRNTQVLN